MNNKQFYKVICAPPEGRGMSSRKEKIYKARSYREANQIGDWFVNVEWEGLNATYQTVQITESEWKSIS